MWSSASLQKDLMEEPATSPLLGCHFHGGARRIAHHVP